MEKLRSVLVTDRSQADVNARNGKGTYNAEDLNRVLRACAWLAERMERHGYRVPFDYHEAYIFPASAQPPEGGTVRGDIRYPGEEAVVRAFPDGEYEFIWWEESGRIVSRAAEYRFQAEKSRELTAVFVSPDDVSNGIVGIGRCGIARIRGE